MQFVDNVSGFLKRELSLSDDQADIIRYGLFSLVATSMNLLAVFILSSAIGVMREALAVTVNMMFFRKVSGGAHSESLSGCIITGTLVSTFLALAAKGASAWLAVPNALIIPQVFALAAVYLYAPADVPQKPITNPRQRTTLRLLSFAYLVLFALLGPALRIFAPYNWSYLYSVAAVGLFWQGFLLTPPGYVFMEKLGRLLEKNL